MGFYCLWDIQHDLWSLSWSGLSIFPTWALGIIPLLSTHFATLNASHFPNCTISRSPFAYAIHSTWKAILLLFPWLPLLVLQVSPEGSPHLEGFYEPPRLGKELPLQYPSNSFSLCNRLYHNSQNCSSSQTTDSVRSGPWGVAQPQWIPNT